MKHSASQPLTSQSGMPLCWRVTELNGQPFQVYKPWFCPGMGLSVTSALGFSLLWISEHQNRKQVTSMFAGDVR